jgi:hypothetical protein
MTDISVTTTDYQVEKRDWLLSMWGSGPGENPSVLLDISTFTAGTHYPKGYLPSGIPLGKITAASTGKKIVVGPYDDAAADGRQTAIGFLHSAVKVPNLLDTTKDAGGALVVCGFVSLSKLPIALDANGQADLKLIYFTA